MAAFLVSVVVHKAASELAIAVYCLFAMVLHGVMSKQASITTLDRDTGRSRMLRRRARFSKARETACEDKGFLMEL